MSTPSQHAVVADHVFDGANVLRKAAVVLQGPTIRAVVPQHDLPASIPIRELPDGAWLAPGFIDIQVNGGGDVLFNDMPTVEGIRVIASAHRKFGTTSLLPTLISDTPSKMATALAAIDEVVVTDASILGIHLEGPFLSPERPGVHDLRRIRAPTPDDAATITAGRNGITVMTLAPESVPKGFIWELAASGVRVCLGHSMATYDETRAAMAEGLTGFTHLFNGMRPLAARDPGPIAAALETSGAWFGMIVDGVHVDPAMLRLAMRGQARPILVTDAMPPVGGRHASFVLYGEDILVDAGRCMRRDGTLAGAMLDMATAVRNCVRFLGVSLETALRFASLHPAGFLGIDHRLGRLAPGYRADIIALEPSDVNILATWVAGHAMPAS